MEKKIEKPKEFTDAEAEAFIRYLTEDEKPRKKKLAEALLETKYGKALFDDYLRRRGLKRAR